MAAKTVELDYGYCLDQSLPDGRGLSLQQLNDLAPKVAELHQGLMAQKAQGKLGFMELPFQGTAELRPIRDEARRLGEIADTLVVLGIGGSALGSTAVDMALAGALRQALPRPAGAMRLFVADNSDPRMFGQLLDGLDLGATAFNVVSKSGSTAETMSQYLVVRSLLEERLGAAEARKRLAFTTDPVSGNLRKIAGQEPVVCLNVPPNVGGRFSVLTAVGLLPLAAAGHDIEALLAGAAAMARACETPELMRNPAYLVAALTTGYADLGRNVLVSMPYASDLLGLGMWFAQLWAESLGKAEDLDGNEVHRGQTPVAAVGATDQHSQVQLYMEGPQDKLIMFLSVDDYGREMVIPKLHGDIDALSYLGGQTMQSLIQAEAKATAAALASRGRPSFCLKLPRIDAFNLGQVIYLLELATAMAGALWHIDPLNQPGVELGKVMTYGLMGRDGFADQKERLNALDHSGKFVI